MKKLLIITLTVLGLFACVMEDDTTTEVDQNTDTNADKDLVEQWFEEQGLEIIEGDSIYNEDPSLPALENIQPLTIPEEGSIQEKLVGRWQVKIPIDLFGTIVYHFHFIDATQVQYFITVDNEAYKPFFEQIVVGTYSIENGHLVFDAGFRDDDFTTTNVMYVYEFGETLDANLADAFQGDTDELIGTRKQQIIYVTEPNTPNELSTNELVITEDSFILREIEESGDIYEEINSSYTSTDSTITVDDNGDGDTYTYHYDFMDRFFVLLDPEFDVSLTRY